MVYLAKRSGPSPSWRRRESSPRPKTFDNDVYMHIRVVAGTRARRGPSLFRPRGAPTRRIAPQDLSLSLTGGSGGPPAKPAWSTSFPARQAWSGRTWLKQPVPDQCWRFRLVSTVYGRWTPDMQSLLHVPSSNPVRPLLARIRRQFRGRKPAAQARPENHGLHRNSSRQGANTKVSESVLLVRDPTEFFERSASRFVGKEKEPICRAAMSGPALVSTRQHVSECPPWTHEDFS